MAIILEAAYSKKLGLPNYSSHSYVVSIRTELNDVSQVQEESSRLYKLLQDTVDKDIQEVGFIPDATRYGMSHPEGSNTRNGNGNGHSNGSNGHTTQPTNGYSRNGQRNTRPASSEDSGISERQIDLINNVVKENNARKGDVEQMAVDMFGGGIRTLNRLQASNLIDALFERYPKQRNTPNQRQPVNTR